MSEGERIDELRRAVARLREALLEGESNPLFVDAAIQRFEFCVELGWRCPARRLSSDHGIELASPKPVLQQAFRLNMIDHEQTWLSMRRDRNLSLHTYRWQATPRAGRVDPAQRNPARKPSSSGSPCCRRLASLAWVCTRPRIRMPSPAVSGCG